MATAPDERAGRDSKSQRAVSWHGEHVLRWPPISHAGLADAVMHLSCKQAYAGATPAAGPISFHSPVVQSAERLTLTQEVDGANPSGAANSIASVAQCIERRASDAEVAGEIPAGSTSLQVRGQRYDV